MPEGPACANSLDPQKSGKEGTVIIHHITEEETEAQRGHIICLRLQVQAEVELGFEPRPFLSAASTHTEYCMKQNASVQRGTGFVETKPKRVMCRKRV